MKRIGLDLGSTWGWAVAHGNLLDHGFVKPSQPGHGARLTSFSRKLSRLIDCYGVDKVYFEMIARHSGTQAAHVWGAYWGAMLKECHIRNIQCRGVPVKTIKKLATSNGNARKSAMVGAAKAKWGYMGGDDNEADAMWTLEAGILLDRGKLVIPEKKRRKSQSDPSK